jgi:PAS domain S-box-containing protein
MSQLNLDNTVFAFTKIMWLNAPMQVMQAITIDPKGKEFFEKWVKTTAVIYQMHFDFVCKFGIVASAQGQDQMRLIRKYHLKKNYNSIFYCTSTEINFGTLNQMNWGPVFQEMGQKAQISISILATELLPKFLNSKLGEALIKQVRAREMSNQQGPLRTVAIGLDKNSESYWMDMFRVMSETVSVGMVLADMTIPGTPLIYINEGFKAVTGYGKEKIGCNCRFLQGPDTEQYLNDEIMAALQHADPLFVKLHNYKANKQKFQCLFALHPVMGPLGEYKFQIGVQLDFTPSPEITRQLIEMERVLRYMPRSMTGEGQEDVLRIMPQDAIGDSCMYPFVKLDPSEVRSAAPAAPAAGGFGGMGGFGAPAAAPAPVPVSSGGGKAAEVMGKGKEVTTKKGKNKDQYGRSFGKKQKAAMLEFTKTLWLQDAQTSLRNLLKLEAGQSAFMEFLKAEYGEGQLEFFLEAQKMEALSDAAAKGAKAVEIYGMFMQTGGKGIGQQERTAATQKMWDDANGASAGSVDATSAIAKIKAEADTTLNMLAFDAFPRFVKSKQCAKVLEVIKSQGGNSGLEGALSGGDDKAPKDADDWLNMFVATAESMPACIVISDMTIPGAPMVYVNQEFCRTTLYEKDEAVGRNCRFLQGPDTEPEAIQVIRNTLSKGQDCHVKLTNYKKDGTLFQNLLSMRPVFDADNIYRYVIGVQFEIKDDGNLKQRLVQLDKLLRLLPSKLPLRSKAERRAKGAMAVKTSGEANALVSNKEAILAQSKQAEVAEMAQGGSRPKSLVSTSQYDPRTLNYDRTIAAFTKIMWLQDPVSACRGCLIDPVGREAFTAFAEGNAGLVTQWHLKFFDAAMQVRMAQGAAQVKKMKQVHSKKNYNATFYCTNTEIEFGTMNTLNWGPVFESMCKWQEQSTLMLATDAFQRFMEHSSSIEYITKIRQREQAGEQLPVRTAAFGVNPQSETFWLDMFKNMSETVSIGMVISDMTIPGIPLAYINEGFQAVTGYGKEKIGTNCRFLQGKETENYLNDEIMASLQQSEPLCIKLHNYKASGQKFQCMFCLHPVFGPAPDSEYKYQIGIQLDFNNQDPDLPRKIAEMARVVRLLPQTIGGEKLPGVDNCLADLQSMIGGGSGMMGGAMAGGMGGGMMGGMGGGMGGGMMGGGGFQPTPPAGAPPSFQTPRMGW